MKVDERLNGYTFKVTWSDDDQCYLGKVDKFKSLGSHGDTAEEALKEIIKVTLFVLDELEMEANVNPL